MVGGYIEIDVLAMLQTVSLVIFLPLFMGITTYNIILRKYTREKFDSNIKPYLPALSAWGMVYVIFTGISTNAHTIVSKPGLLLVSLMVWVFFYAFNYLISIKTGRRYFNRQDSVTLAFGTVLRNLAISIGLAATAFGVLPFHGSLAFLFQGQSAAWFGQAERKTYPARENSGEQLD